MWCHVMAEVPIKLVGISIPLNMQLGCRLKQNYLQEVWNENYLLNIRFPFLPFLNLAIKSVKMKISCLNITAWRRDRPCAEASPRHPNLENNYFYTTTKIASIFITSLTFLSMSLLKHKWLIPNFTLFHFLIDFLLIEYAFLKVFAGCAWNLTANVAPPKWKIHSNCICHRSRVEKIRRLLYHYWKTTGQCWASLAARATGLRLQ